jgi:hypothetical protein
MSLRTKKSNVFEWIILGLILLAFLVFWYIPTVIWIKSVFDPMIVPKGLVY